MQPLRPYRRNGHFYGWFFDEVYKANVYLLWPVNPGQVSRFVKQTFGFDYDCTPFGARCIELADADDQPVGQIICLSEWDDKDCYDHAALVHECFHATCQILGRRDIKIEPDGDSEPYAYLIESLHRRCLTMLRAKKPKKRSKKS